VESRYILERDILKESWTAIAKQFQLTRIQLIADCTSLLDIQCLVVSLGDKRTMASVALHPQETINPSLPESDTSYAPYPSDLFEPTDTLVTSSSTNPTRPPDQRRQSQRKNKPRIPSLSIRSRAFSTASSSPSSPIRRKPLPVTASPAATRFSTSDHLVLSGTRKELPELPGPRLPRAYSVDSPTLHEFPPTPKELPSLPSDHTLSRDSYSRCVLVA
jgi:hypothetical protein